MRIDHFLIYVYSFIIIVNATGAALAHGTTVTIETLPEAYQGSDVSVEIKGEAAKSIFNYMVNKSNQEFDGQYDDCKYGQSLLCCETGNNYTCLMYVSKEGVITQDPIFDTQPKAADSQSK